MERQHLGSVCETTYTRSYITHFNHTAPYGDEERGLWEQVHASNKYGWKDGQKKERVRARIRWLRVCIKRKTANGIKGRGRTEGHPERGIKREK